MSTNDTSDRPTVWEVSPDYPGGRGRPMTDDEYAQWQADQAAAAVPPTPPPPTAAEQLVQILTTAPDFDTAKADMQSWLASQQNGGTAA